MAKTSSNIASRGVSKSPQHNNKSAPSGSDEQSTSTKSEPNANGEQSKPLAPPPRPGQQNVGNTPDFFSNSVGGSLSMEPNPFEQSFGAPPDTPNGTKLPSVASLTSPSSLLPNGGTTPFNWGGGSLRTGPLSPAMLSGPTNDYFGDTHLRGGFPTPNESSLRTGLTPGGSGSMFPAPSPSSQAAFAQLQSGNATPSTLDFHRTAMTAAAAKREQLAQQANQQQQTSSGAAPVAPTSVPQDLPAVTSAPVPKTEAKTYDQDSNAANSLYLLAQGRGSAQPQAPFVVPPPPVSQTNVPVSLPASVSGLPNQTPVPVPVVPGRMSNGHQSRTTNGNGVPMTNGSATAAGNHSNNDGARTGRGMSEAVSAASDDNESAPRQNAKGRGKRNSSGDAGSTANNRRRTNDAPAKSAPPSKKAKLMSNPSPEEDEDMYLDSQSDDDDGKLGKDGQPKQKMTDEEKRKNFLERNRVAALKCRQRKKQWLQNLQTKVELYSTENESLSSQITQLREEVVNLKTLLLAHKDCPVTQQQGLHGTSYMQQSIESFNQQMNPYAMAPSIGNQPVMAGSRRFS